MPAAERGIKAQKQHDKAIEGLLKLVRAETEEQHNQQWYDYQQKWKLKENWIKTQA
ncbi:hypothetical protein [Sporisorium scitamineum]|uniref:Uncharacterized protein n=1 Tax=Sporisorium scitamineum TaxID=49012 RepID=A0A0F7S074_9BASI|nr:hypothetical protein [Sporisorium scitamineum]